MGNGKLVFGAVVPHPPLMVPEVGKDNSLKVKATQKALEITATKLAKAKPDVLIFITPHGDVNPNAMGVYCAPQFSGNLGHFGAPNVDFLYKNDFQLCHYIIVLCQQIGIPILVGDRYKAQTLDHGIIAPLYFLKQKLPDVFLIPITFSMLPISVHYQFGQAISKAIELSGQRVAVIASGDLSHRLTESSTDYEPMGKEFDRTVVESLKQGNVIQFLNIPPTLREKAGECGYRSISILLGAFAEINAKFEVLSYEAPFGVGYMVADIEPKDISERTDTSLVDFPKSQEKTKVNNLIELARKTVEIYINTGKVINTEDSCLKSFETKRAGIFVTIRNQEDLRGCIGTIVPTQKNIIEETIQNAISAAIRDRRFSPIIKKELGNLFYSVSILNPPEPVMRLEDLDPKKYGLIVSTGYKQGLLLPDLEGITTVEEQLTHAMLKAEIMSGEPIWLYRFTVEEFKE